MRSVAIVIALVGTTSVARAGYLETTFSEQMHVDAKDLLEVAGFELPAGAAYNRVIVGHYKNGKYIVNAAVLMKCGDKDCATHHEWLGQGDLEVLGVVDLAAPGAFPTTKVRWPTVAWFTPLGPARAKWPALLVRTTTSETITDKSYTMRDVAGTHLRAELAILSLARADAASPRVLVEVVDEHWPTGAGVYRTFEVDPRGGLIATESRSIDRELACIAPKPVKLHYALDAKRRRFAVDLGDHARGC
jgi:hypothetical protein